MRSDTIGSMRGDTTAVRRHAQMFPTLSDAEMAQATRFGSVVSFQDGERLFTAGRAAPGLYLLREGRVRVTRRDGVGGNSLIVEHGKNDFVAEVGQLAGRASLVDAEAIGAVEAVLLPPERLRDLLVQEAILGERILRSLILRRVSLIELGDGGPLFIGSTDQANVARLSSFLARNGYPYRLLDPTADTDAAALLAQYAPAVDDLPLVVCHDGTVLRNPTEAAMAEALGMVGQPQEGHTYDVAIVGAGPAGLSTAVYAASEGLSTIVVDSRAFGGQAGESARIENYFGFPTGITGQALVARAFVQAQKFGAEIAIPVKVEQIRDAGQDGHALRLESGAIVSSKCIIVATGARYRRPAIAGLKRFEGRGVWYWASPIEARLCRGAEVILVGGGNSAGQAAVFLASHAAKVRMMVRGKGLAESMSRYLIDRIAGIPNITLMTQTQIIGMDGDDSGLEYVRWRGPGGEEYAPIRNVFLFVGAEPASEWLEGSGIALDAKGFVITGLDGSAHLETSRSGIFAAGDVRSGSVKRVGGAIGEGAAVVAAIHRHLERLERSSGQLLEAEQ